MAHYRHIIWDWNGTLLDDAWLCVDIVNRMLERRGKPPTTLELYEQLFDFPVENYYRKVGFDFSAEPFDTAANEWMAEYNRRRTECSLRDGAQDAVAACARAGLTQHILSVYPQNELEAVIAQFGMADAFEHVFGQDDIYAVGKLERGKGMIAELDAEPRTIVFIGDTTHDYEVSQAMGIDCILVPGGHHSHARLEATGAHVCVSLAAALAELGVAL